MPETRALFPRRPAQLPKGTPPATGEHGGVPAPPWHEAVRPSYCILSLPRREGDSMGAALTDDPPAVHQEGAATALHANVRIVLQITC
jgi:hypothetical protein